MELASSINRSIAQSVKEFQKRKLNLRKYNRGRGKLKLELIPNEKLRKRTFEKRSKGLVKKCGELSTLCNVDVCMIINGGPTQEVHTYPDKSEEVHRIIQRYLTATKHRPPKKITGLSDFYLDHKKKIDSELAKLSKAQVPISDELIDQYCPNGDYNELPGFMNLLDERIKEAEVMIQQKKQNQHLDHHQLHGGLNFDYQGPHYPIPKNKNIPMGLDDDHQFVSIPLTNIGLGHGYASHAPSSCNYNINMNDPYHHQGYYNDPMNIGTTGPVVGEDPDVQVGMLEDYGMFGNNNVNSNPSSNTSSSMMIRQYLSEQPQPLAAVMSLPWQLPAIPSYDYQHQIHGYDCIDRRGEEVEECSEFFL